MWFSGRHGIPVAFLITLKNKMEKNTGNLVIATHGFVKMTQKTPESEIAHAEALRKNYYNEKKK